MSRGYVKNYPGGVVALLIIGIVLGAILIAFGAYMDGISLGLKEINFTYFLVGNVAVAFGFFFIFFSNGFLQRYRNIKKRTCPYCGHEILGDSVTFQQVDFKGNKYYFEVKGYCFNCNHEISFTLRCSAKDINKAKNIMVKKLAKIFPYDHC